MPVSIPSPKSKSERRALIYFIPGNPGLIEYYRPFLSYLRGLINDHESHTAYDLYGRNLLGFADDEHEPFSSINLPYDLEGQIVGIGKDAASQSRPDTGEAYDKVILIGHSVGAYIAVEILSRSDGSVPLEHGFLLFPTLTHIAESPSGKRATKLLQVPGLRSHGHVLAQLILGLFTAAMVLRFVVERVTGFSKDAVETTLKWLSSRDGVWQAMHLGKTELQGIGEETWDDSFWAGQGGVPKFFIFYGNNDHWVNDDVRADFIRRRAAGKAERVKVEIDQGNTPHAFCTKDGKR